MKSRLKALVPLLPLLLFALFLLSLLREDPNAPQPAEPIICPPYPPESASPAPAVSSVTLVGWVKGFDSADTMVEQSSTVIVGKLVSAEVQRRNGMPFTMNTVEVLEVRKGDLQVGDRITVQQTGAAGTETPPPAEQPLLVPDTQYALCLELTEPHETYGQYYKIAGGYQGQATYTDTADFAANFAGNFK